MLELQLDIEHDSHVLFISTIKKLALHFDKMYKIYSIANEFNQDYQDDILDYLNNRDFQHDWNDFCIIQKLQIKGGKCSIANINSALNIILEEVNFENDSINDFKEKISSFFLLFFNIKGTLIIVDLIKKSINSILQKENITRYEYIIHSSADEINNLLINGFNGNFDIYKKYNPLIFLYSINLKNIHLINDEIFIYLLKDLRKKGVDYLFEIIIEINILKYSKKINIIFESIIACGYGYKIFQYLFNIEEKIFNKIILSKKYKYILNQLFYFKIEKKYLIYKKNLIDKGFIPEKNILTNDINDVNGTENIDNTINNDDEIINGQLIIQNNSPVLELGNNESDIINGKSTIINDTISKVSNKNNFNKYDKIVHQIYGRGVIINIDGENCIIEFKKGGIKYCDKSEILPRKTIPKNKY